MKDDYTGLMEICKRATKSGYKELIVHNRMLIGCYDITQDTDIGMHYILHIPDDLSDIYNNTFIINIEDVIMIQRELKKEADNVRNEKGLPPRSISWGLLFDKEKNKVVIKLLVSVHNLIPNPNPKRKSLVLGDSIYIKERCLIYPIVDSTNYLIENMLITFNNIKNRISNKVVAIFDGLENDIFEKVKGSPKVVYCKLEIEGEKVRVPFLKSFFRGITKFDKMIFCVTTTNIKGIMLFTMTFESKGIIEQYISYLQNF